MLWVRNRRERIPPGSPSYWYQSCHPEFFQNKTLLFFPSLSCLHPFADRPRPRLELFPPLNLQRRRPLLSQFDTADHFQQSNRRILPLQQGSDAPEIETSSSTEFREGKGKFSTQSIPRALTACLHFWKPCGIKWELNFSFLLFFTHKLMDKLK